MSTNEKGHARNAALYEKVVEDAVSYGAVYNPANILITIPALTAHRDEILSVLENLKVSKVNLTDAVNVRQMIFEQLKAACTFIVAEATACGADKKIIDDMHSITRLIHGHRAKKIDAEEAPATPLTEDPTEGLSENEKTPESDPASKLKRSVSHVSYDNRVTNFAHLVELTKKIPGYAPNEAFYTTASLEAFTAQARLATKNVNISVASIINMRTQRDKLLYHPETGALARVARIKAYVLVLFGPDSYEYKSLTALPFFSFHYRGI